MRVAVIGCGRQGLDHLAACGAIEGGEIEPVSDVDGARATAAAERFGARPYTRYEDLLANEATDLVSIATMPATHRAVTVLALDSGAHVLCEKPMALNLGEAREMAAAAR